MTTPTTRRRALTLLGAAAGFTALPVCAQATVPMLDELGAVFRALEFDVRINLQEVMAGVGVL